MDLNLNVYPSHKKKEGTRQYLLKPLAVHFLLCATKALLNPMAT